MSSNIKNFETDCCIAGGGPAGMMLGFLLARAGVKVIVLEKHKDFLRDFRGDTVHPSTIELMFELGLGEDFLNRPHQKVNKIAGWIGDERITIADLSRLKAKAPYIAFMPQWDFLDFLSDHAKSYNSFNLMMEAEVVDIIEEGGKVRGALVNTNEGHITIRSKLLIGADGRHSTVRQKANFKVIDKGAPIDVLWFAVSRKESDPDDTMGRFLPGKLIVLINRGQYWQCGYVIPKGEAENIKRGNIVDFQNKLVAAIPFFEDRITELDEWDKIKLLTVKVDRLDKWYREGLLCIGDSAHAMSPVGGVGINLAIQDAVAAANILAPPLINNDLILADLKKVQDRREWPVRMTQRMQLFMQDRIIFAVLKSDQKLPIPLPLRLLQRYPIFRRITARLIGVGFRPEHIKTKDIKRLDRPAF